MKELSPSEVGRRLDDVLARAQDHFMGKGAVHETANAIERRLRELGIDYAIAGALALAEHGVERLTVDVDILITRDGLERFKREWLGRGYIEFRPGGRPVRDTVNDVRIDFLIAGDFPGDGQPKPVAFPEPGAAAVQGTRHRVLALPRLVELKLASGMTAPHRMQDLADVLRLVREARLPREFARELDPYVRAKFDELWLLAQHPDEEY